MAQEETKTDFMTVVCALIALVTITYIALLALFMVYPPSYKILVGNPMTLYEKFKSDQILYNTPYRDILWAEADDKPAGVTINDDAQTDDGATLYVSAHHDGAFLIDRQGEILHSWRFPYEKACPEEAEKEMPAHMYFWARAHLDEKGAILGLIDCYSSSHLVKLDKDSNEIWRYSGRPHHDIEKTSDGHFYTFSTEARTAPNANMPQIRDPYMDEFVVKLDAQGKEVQRISIYDAFVDSPAEHMLKQVLYDPTDGRLNRGDMLHPNSITLITSDVAQIYPFLDAGQLLLSFRNNSLLAVLDTRTFKITHAIYGGWRAQHDPRFWKDGTVIMFDNEGWLGKGGASRVMQIDLLDGLIIWQYTGTQDKPLYSAYNSSVDPLPNGNILITESAGGRLLEVNAKGEIVWEFVNPHRVEHEGKTLIPAIFRGRRYNGEMLDFLKE